MGSTWDREQTVGVLKEVKAFERRVALTPHGVSVLVADGRTVIVENGAGEGSSHSDVEYEAAGAIMASNATEVAERATLLLHVKEPQPQEFALFSAEHTLFTYLHLAAAHDVAEALVTSGCRAIAYESVEVEGQYPLLAPMSAVAGRLATQLAASFLEARNGGLGMLLGGVPGTERATVLVLGAGVAGQHAAEVAAGMGAEVIVADLDLTRAERVAALCGPNARAVTAAPGVVDELAPLTEVIISAVLVPGRNAPIVVTQRTVDLMPRGSVIVDIAIDQGGSVEGVQSTTHAEPVRSMGHVRVSATPNMPAAVPRTSTAALTSATLPYVRALAAGWTAAIAQRPELIGAVNVEAGRITHPAVREALGR